MTSSRVAVHQVIPFLHAADASGAHTLAARDALRSGGFESEVFAGDMDGELRGEAHPFDALDGLAPPGRTVLLYQLAVGSVLVDELLRRPEPLLVNYHNLTPASFFWRWAPTWLAAVDSGRRDLYRLAGVARHAIAVSRFNQLDLLSAGYRSSSVVPPFVAGAAPEAPGYPWRSASDRSRDASADAPGAGVGDASADAPGAGVGDASADAPGAGSEWLFVGKLLPHKAAHDLLKALAVHRRAFDGRATLTLVGGEPVPEYTAALRKLADALGVAEAVRFRGRVDDRELVAAYRRADVLVCLSDHEGFCFPLLEAMRHRVPVVAFGTAAIPETVGDAGLVLRDKDPLTVAAAVHRVVGDRRLRDRLDAAAQQRLAAFAPATVAARFVAEVGGVIDRMGLVAGVGGGPRLASGTVPAVKAGGG